MKLPTALCANSTRNRTQISPSVFTSSLEVLAKGHLIAAEDSLVQGGSTWTQDMCFGSVPQVTLDMEEYSKSNFGIESQTRHSHIILSSNRPPSLCRVFCTRAHLCPTFCTP